MIRKIKDEHPDSNIVAIDYDPSATRINQENRIKLMLANAQRIGHGNAAPTAPEQEAVPV
jgi:predicted nucleotide-binding protein (sugar kinase/HSP70/actin superfamily)